MLSAQSALERAYFILREAGLTDASRQARTILCWICHVEHTIFLPHTLSAQQEADFFSAIGARAQGVPLQHIMGLMHFRYMTLESRPGVFVVRPETEAMVEDALRTLKEQALKEQNSSQLAHSSSSSSVSSSNPDSQSPTYILDLCTGSGAIALACATERPHSYVCGVDISDAALELAWHNAYKVSGCDHISAHSIPSIDMLTVCPDGTDSHPIPSHFFASSCSTITFVHSDIRNPSCENLLRPDRIFTDNPHDSSEKHQSRSSNHQQDMSANSQQAMSPTHQWDMVISNPPYVPAGGVKQAEALHDPDLALYGGGLDGMAMPSVVISLAYRLLKDGGVFFMEHDPSQAGRIAQLCREEGFVNVQMEKDFTGRYRWVRAYK